ncbi:MAG: hypothetical protein AAFR61_13430 [Bacteroidota bacterium]
MFDFHIPQYFSQEELEALAHLQGARLEQIDYVIWRNIANPQEVYEALDWIVLGLDSGLEVALHVNADNKGIEVRPLDFEEAVELTKLQFNGQVELSRVDMSQSPHWQALMGKAITMVGLIDDGPAGAQNHLLQLQFGTQALEISLNEEGLLVKPVSSQ